MGQVVDAASARISLEKEVIANDAALLHVQTSFYDSEESMNIAV